MPESTDREFQQLLQQAIDDTLSKEEGLRLQELAKGNRDRLEQLVDHALIASLLIEEGGSESVAALVDFVAPGPAASATRPSWLTASLGRKRQIPGIAAVAAGLILLASLVLWNVGIRSQNTSIADSTDDSVAQLAQSIGVQWEGDNRPAAGASLLPGTLKFSEGLVQIEFYSGAQVIVEGPAELELITAYRADCRSGRIRARVPPQARGFSVLTPTFELVDLGTEFGMDVAATGEAKVKVFDGEVELHSSDRKQSLLGGQALKFERTGESNPISETETRYPSFEEMKSRAQHHASAKLESWLRWNESLQGDPRIVARYDFESREIENGAIVGCHWADGRWPGKGALEFRRSGDRVRVDVPGEFDALTMSAWIRLDALAPRHQALLLTDEYKVGHIHWQIGPSGDLRFGSRIRENKKGRTLGGASPARLFNQNRLGVWSFVCTTFDRQAGEVRHYYNGREVSRHQGVSPIPLHIGSGDIGNWSVPLERPEKPRPLRNFVGRMDEMTIWNTALDAVEIRRIYKNHRP